VPAFELGSVFEVIFNRTVRYDTGDYENEIPS